MANIGGAGQVEVAIWVRLVKLGRAADGHYGDLPHVLIDRGQALTSFCSREGDGVVGAYELAGWICFVRGQPGWNIDSNLPGEREPLIDQPDSIERRSLGGPGEPSAQHGIDDDGSDIGFAWKLAHHRAAADVEHAPIGGGVAGQSLRVEEFENGEMAAQLARE